MVGLWSWKNELCAGYGWKYSDVSRSSCTEYSPIRPYYNIYGKYQYEGLHHCFPSSLCSVHRCRVVYWFQNSVPTERTAHLVRPFQTIMGHRGRPRKDAMFSLVLFGCWIGILYIGNPLVSGGPLQDCYIVPTRNFEGCPAGHYLFPYIKDRCCPCSVSECLPLRLHLCSNVDQE